ncbi:hypothetical protein D1872_246080 [compost metagenome]
MCPVQIAMSWIKLDNPLNAERLVILIAEHGYAAHAMRTAILVHPNDNIRTVLLVYRDYPVGLGPVGNSIINVRKYKNPFNLGYACTINAKIFARFDRSGTIVAIQSNIREAIQ